MRVLYISAGYNESSMFGDYFDMQHQHLKSTVINVVDDFQEMLSFSIQYAKSIEAIGNF